MSVRCVFRCESKTPPSYEGGPVMVTLSPRYSDDQGNRFLNDFAQYTPQGRVDLVVDNPPAAEQFEIGAFYDLTFERRETPSAG